MSEVKVNKISPKQTCTTVTLGDSGDDFVVATGVNFKTAAVKDAAGNVIVSRCGSNITIGSSGAAIALACGATQTGFGRTGTVDWDTTAKTAGFTAVSGNGYFVNTTSGAITATLPAGSAGDIVAFADYANTFDTNNLIIAPNGTDKIGGTNANATVTTKGASTTFVYVDSTQGWKQVNDATLNTVGVGFITATGGTITTCGNYKIHTFTGPGTFCVSGISSSPACNVVDYLVVAGGAGTGGRACQTGGGGAGGFRLSNSTCMPAPLTSPLANPTGVTVSVTSYPITVGGGGAPLPVPTAGTTNPGSNSVFSTITSTGGGGGGIDLSPGDGASGGSGGGARNGTGGTGNTPPVAPPQGNPGGGGDHTGGPAYGSGGGGGAGAAGVSGTTAGAGAGGAGSYVVGAGFAGCNGTPGPVCGARYFAGGGGGSAEPTGSPNSGAGGVGGGGAGAVGNPGTGVAGGTNTGGGGGSGNDANGAGTAGGSGIVIIRYKYQ